ncbi:hypothetical protein [Clostridium sp.]|uniref:hypothetical protein n=1 Tax=Clostridium sp. TaxID=1506 RepID=UPI003D6D2CD8
MKDKFASLKKIKSVNIGEIFKREKDIFSLILQYGIMLFPIGLEAANRLVFIFMD